jgi:hypothetical protein
VQAKGQEVVAEE